MTTLDRFYGVRIGTSCSDKILDYAGTISFVNGGLAILFGIFSFALGIAAICTNSSAGFIGYGIWCGFIYVISGIVYMSTCRSRIACQVTTVMAFAMISTFCSVIQFSLGVVGTAFASRRPGLESPYDEYVFDIFDSNMNQKYCTADTIYTFAVSWAPINVLLLITGFLELIFHLFVAILTFIALCCGNREVIFEEGAFNPAFSQIEGSTYRPQMYKFHDSMP